MNAIKSNLTRREAADKIVVALRNHYRRIESDVAIGFNADGEVDFDYLSSNSRAVELVYFSTNNGFTFDLDACPSDAAYWDDEAKNEWLSEYIADELKNLEFDNLIEFA